MNQMRKLTAQFARANPSWLIGLGGLIRLIFASVFCLTTNWPNYDPLDGPTGMTTGVDGYVQIARTLLVSGEYALEPGGPPVPFRPPVQPFLMLVFGAWTPNYWHVVWLVFSVAIGTATLWVLWRCAQLVNLPPLLTNLLLLAAAVHPYLIFASRVPGIPSALIFMTTLVLFSVLRFSTSNGKHPFQCGAIWGIASLTHGCFLPLLLPMSAFLALALRGSSKQKLGKSSLVVLTALLVISPWTVRNQITFGRLIPVASGGALQYWIADYFYFHGEFRNRPQDGNVFERIAADFERNHGRKLEILHGGVLDLQDDALLAKEAKQQIRSQPSIMAARALKGSLFFWTTMDRGLKKAIMVGLMSLPLILLGLTLLVLNLMRHTWSVEYILAVLLMLGFWGLFALVQAIGPYFVAISPCLLFVIADGLKQTGLKHLKMQSNI